MSRECARAKSDMTPCFVKDGDLAIAIAKKGWGSGSRKICVGCEHGVGLLLEERQKYLSRPSTPRSEA